MNPPYILYMITMILINLNSLENDVAFSKIIGVSCLGCHFSIYFYFRYYLCIAYGISQHQNLENRKSN